MNREEIVSKKISRIAFGVVSPAMVKKISVVTVITPELYNADGYPVNKGLMDISMGVIDPGLRCKTCGGRIKTCPGHFGSITLSKPVLHILFMSQIYNYLRSFCKDCGRIQLPADKIDDWETKISEAKEKHDLQRLRNLVKGVIAATKNVKTCPHCGLRKDAVKLSKPSTFQEGDVRLWPTEIRERFEKIPDDDLKLFGQDPAVMRPEWTILSLLAVPPITVRPSITLESGERSEDDLTHKLSDIVRVNQRLLENINAGAPEIIVEDLWDLLQYHVTTFFDNKIAQIPPARHRTHRPLKTLAQRLSGKEGRFRYNLAGKRVNFCARSVISPDPFIDIDEVGVPLHVAKELTIPERATSWNIPWLKKMIKNYGKYPSANYVFTKEGKRKKITSDTVDQIISEIEAGWIVERQLLEGDVVIFNRQPSLHRLSMMGHRVVITPGKTLRINPTVCRPYNADFDGDEMNLHLPQTEEARAEAEKILNLKNQISTPRYGLSIIGVGREILLGIYYLTKGLKLTKNQVNDLIIETGLDDELPTPEEKGLWDGKQIFSLLLPKDLNFNHKGLDIKKGQLISGVIDKNHIGSEGGVLIHTLYHEYDPEVTAKFINELNRLGLAVSRLIPHTMSFYDLDIPEEEQENIKKILVSTHKEAENVIKKYKKNEIVALPGKTVEETFEAKMLHVLSAARNELGKIIEPVVKEDSTLVNSARAGAGDKILNITLMSGFAGQQALRGERINFGYKGRTLSHFKRGDLGPRAHGFIENGYSHGLDPIELFFNAIVGRDSLMDTAMRTPKSGYMQRRLINALQDLKVDYDGTVRDSSRSIIQFKFGGDNIDVSRSNGGKLTFSD